MDLEQLVSDAAHPALLLSAGDVLRCSNRGARELLGADPIARLQEDPAFPGFLKALRLREAAEIWIELPLADGRASLFQLHGRRMNDASGNPHLLLQLQAAAPQQDLAARNAELEAQVKALTHQLTCSQMLLHATHDLSNVLQSIELKLAELEIDEDPYAEDLPALQSSTRHATSLLRRLIQYGRGECATRSPAAAADVLAATAELIRPLLRRNTHLHTELEADLPGVALSAQSLEHIVLNLALNAQQAMGCEGNIWIRARLCRLAVPPPPQPGAQPLAGLAPGQYLHLQVQDDGPGMSPEVQARAMEPLYTTRPDEGTGLGLSIVRSLCERSGGTFQLTSQEGHGTIADVLLPVAPGEARFKRT